MAKVAFVQTVAYDFLGVMHISSILKESGHETDAFILNAENHKEIVNKIKKYAPDIVGFTSMTGDHQQLIQLSQSIKENIKTTVVFGGPHPTFFPDIINEPSIDAICRGEGEFPMLEITNNIDKKETIAEVKNCWVKTNGTIIKNDIRPLIQDLDTLPFPDRDLYIRRYPFLNNSKKNFMSSRGCPYKCTFCFNHVFIDLHKGKGKIVRYRTPENLLKEIEEVYNKFRFKTIYMQDDTFILDRKFIIEFAPKYSKRYKMPLICLIRADLATDEIVENLKLAGCKIVCMGIESGSEKIRNTVLKKSISNLDIINAASLLKKSKIKFRTYNMLGLPGETMEDAFETVKINAKIKTDYPWCSLFYPLPGTELTKMAEELNIIDTNKVKEGHPSFFKHNFIKSTRQNELANLHKLFYFGVKFPILIPIIKKLITIKPNIFFDIIFLLGYALMIKGSENLSLKEIFSLGISNVRKYYFKK